MKTARRATADREINYIEEFNMTKAQTSVKEIKDYGSAPLQNLSLLEGLYLTVKDRPIHLPGMVTFSGPSGFGKSTAAAYVTAKYQAYYVEIRSTWTRRSFLEAIHQQMGIDPRGTVTNMLNAVSHELAISQRPIIFDEFDRAVIKEGLMELVRDIYEQSGSPIILIGEENLPQKLKPSEKFHGRIMAWEQAKPANLDDARTLNTHYCPQVLLKNDILSWLVEQSYGSVRRIVTNIEMITRFGKAEGLKEVGRAEYGDRSIYTGQPPVPRSFAGPSSVLRRAK